MSSSESTQSQDNTPKKSRVFKKGDKNDPSRFQGGGVNFRAKLIGIEDVGEARGDKMCQDAITRLKAIIKVSGEHKQRININVSLDGLKILDERSGVVMHHHAVHKISFIARDVNDARAFGYIYGPGDGSHQFYGIKTDKAAEGLVLTLRDLFQVVFEMKKREVEEAKKQKEAEDNKENEQQAETAALNKGDTDSKGGDVTTGTGGDVTTETGGGVGALLDLENELASISQGIQQMDEYGSGVPTVVAPAAGGSPWGAQSSTLLAGMGAQQTHAHAAPFAAQFGPGTASPQAGLFSSSSSVSSSPAAYYQQQQHFQNPPPQPAFQQPIPQPSASPSIFSGGQLYVKLPPVGISAGSSTTPPPSSVAAQRPKNIQMGGPVPHLPAPSATLGRHASTAHPTAAAPHTAQMQQGSQGTQSASSWMTFDSPPGAAPTVPTIGTQAVASIPQAVSHTPPPTAVQGFGNSFTGDSFQTDPFLTSTPQPTTAPVPPASIPQGTVPTTTTAALTAPNDKYSVFSSLDTVSSDGFGDSSVFGDASGAVSDQGGAAFNSAFASSPIQPEVMINTPPVTESEKIEGTPKKADPFGDLVGAMTETPLEGKKDFKESPTKPTLLQLSQQPNGTTSGLLAPAADPFGGPVSPMTSAQLDKLVTAGESLPEDPFDTSSIKLKPSVGPFDTSQLRPKPADGNISSTAEIFQSQFEDEDVYSEINLPEKPPASSPSPTASPPPLPNQPPPLPSLPTQISLESDVVPVLPPRGSPAVSSLRKQHTIDVGDLNPPPLPLRPGSGGKGVVGFSPSLHRQQTIQFPMLPGEDVAPPPPPPRTSAPIERKRPPLNRAKTMPSPPPTSDTPPPPPPRPHSPQNLSMFTMTATSTTHTANRQISEPPWPSNVHHTLNRPVSEPAGSNDPFAVTLPRSRASSRGSGASVSPSSSISRARPRPRPRPKTPAGTSSGLSLVGRSGSPLVADRPASSASLECPNERKDSVSSSGAPSDPVPHAVKFDAFSSHMFESSTDPAWPGTSSTPKGQSTSPKMARSVTPSTSSRPSSSHNENLQDPFANVDPFTKNTDDPFSSQPDPLNMDSPQDPFKKEFTAENQKFETTAITVDTDPFASDPFENDDLFSPSPIPTPKESNNLHNMSGQSDVQDISVTNHSMFDFNSSNYQMSEASISIMSSDKSATDTTISSEKSPHFSLPKATNLTSETVFSDQFTTSSSTPPKSSTWTVFNNGTPSPTKANNTFNGDTATSKAWASFPKDNGGDNVDNFSSSLSADAGNCKDADSSSANSEMAEAFGDDFSRSSPSLPPNSSTDNSQMANQFGANPFG